MSQVNIKQTTTHVAPPSGMLGYSFDQFGNAVRVNVDGSTTILATGNLTLPNIMANLGLGLEVNLPAIGTVSIGDIYVTTDTFKIYTAVDDISWGSLALQDVQFVTDSSQVAYILYQYDNDTLTVIGDVITPQNWIDFIPQDPIPSYLVGRMFYDEVEHTWTFFNDIDGISLQLGEELRARLVNDTGGTLLDGKAVAIIGAIGPSLQVELLDTSVFNSAIRAFGLMTIETDDGNPGYAVRFGAVRGLNTDGMPIGSLIYGDPLNPGEWSINRPPAPYYPVRIGIVMYEDISDGVIGVDTLAFNGSDTTVNIEGALNGLVTMKASMSIIVEGGVIYYEADNEVTPTDNLPFVVNGVRYMLDTTTGSGTGGKARVALTAGTDTPLPNYVYVLESGGVGVLTANTTGFPANSCPVAVASPKTVSHTDTYGCLIARRWNNTVKNSGGDGIYQYILKRLRLEGAKYQSGVDQTVTIITNPGSIDNLNHVTVSGIVFQIHEQTYQGKDGTEYYIVNHPTTPYLRITDLNECDVDANGVSLRANNTRYGLNVFGGQNSADAIDRQYVMLPNGSYSSDNNAINDVNNFAVTAVPIALQGTAFRVTRIVVNYSTSASGTITNLLGTGNFQDERGQPLGIGGGGSSSGSAQTAFSDAVFTLFNSVDATKIVDFLLSGITTGNTRTLTVPDISGLLAVYGMLDDFKFGGDVQLAKKLILEWVDGSDPHTLDFATVSTSGQGGTAYPFLTRGNLVLQPRASDTDTLGDLVIMTGAIAVPRVVVTATGDTGFNTITPAERVHIEGNMRANIHKVYEGSDYVGWVYGNYVSTSDNYIELVNNTADAGLRIYNTGDATFANEVTADDFILSSDRRLKDKINYDLQGISIDGLKPCMFYLKGKFKYGFIAQDMQKTHPELVQGTGEEKENGEIDYLSIKKDSIIAIIIKEVQELKETVKMIPDLLREINELKEKVKQLEQG